MVQSRLPFNSPDMENPTNRRGVLTRSAAKALRQSNRNLSSALEGINQPAFKSNIGKTNKSSPDSLTPPRRKVLFSDDTKGGVDKENMESAASSSIRRTRAGTPFRSNKAPVKDKDEVAGAKYYSIPSITTTTNVSTVTDDACTSTSDDSESSSTSSGWSVWVLHTVVLFVAAAWLLNEHYTQLQQDDVTSSSEGGSMLPSVDA